MKIAFWSNVHGQTGTTSNLLTLAFMCDILFGRKSILLQTQYKLNQLEVPLVSGKARESIKKYGMGMDSLIKGIKAGKNTADLLKACCISLSELCIDFLPGTNQTRRDIYEEEITNTFHEMLQLAEECYEVVFIDANAGMNSFIEKLWTEVDLLIVCLSQNRRIIDDYFQNYEAATSKILYLFGNYDRRSHLSISNLQRQYKILKPNNTLLVPYNTEFRDAVSAAQLMPFFYRNIYCEREDENYYFMKEVKRSARILMKCAFGREWNDSAVELLDGKMC